MVLKLARGLVPALLVGLLVALVHRPALSARAAFLDDDVVFLGNALLLEPSWGHALEVVRQIDGAVQGRSYYMPLTSLSLMLDRVLGAGPEHLAPIHRTSLGLHALSTTLLVLLLRRLFGSTWAACLGGLLFGAHPLAVEPVAWITARKIGLAGALAIGSLLAYVRYAKGGGRAPWFASLLLLVLALAAHPSAVCLPLLFLVLDFWPLRREPLRWPEKLPHFAVCGLWSLVTLASQARAPGVELASGVGQASLGARLLYYLRQTAWPAVLAPVQGLEPAGVSGCLFLVALVLAALAALRWTRAPAACGLFFAIPLLPTLGVLRYSWVEAANRYAYLPAVGLAMFIAWGLALTLRRGRATAFISSAAALALIGGAAHASRAYLEAWRDTEALYRRSLAAAPEAAPLHNNFATWLVAAGRDREAERHRRRALELEPECALFHFNLGNLLRRTGRPEAAVQAYRSALTLQPDLAAARANLGALLFELECYDLAAAEFERAVGAQPELAAAHFGLGNCHLSRGRVDEAIACFRRALELDSGLAPARQNLSLALEWKQRHP